MACTTTQRVCLHEAFVLSVGGILAAAGACVPPGPIAHEEGTLSAHVEMAPAELKALDEVEFTVEIDDAVGVHTTEITEVLLEVREVGGDWVEIPLTPGSESFMGTGIFSSSGDYELRVLGMEHMGHMMEEMHTSSFHVDRAHVDVDPFHIEYESEPGHMHAGEETMLMFWVATEDGGDPVTGLTPEIIVEESDGHRTTLDVAEAEPGVYQSMMNFVDGGESHVEFRFVDGTGQSVDTDFHFDVSESH